MLPGLVFFFWGVYWTVAACRRHLRAQASGRPIQPPLAWYPFAAAGRWLWALEPCLKVLGGPIGISIELYFDSHNGFRCGRPPPSFRRGVRRGEQWG